LKADDMKKNVIFCLLATFFCAVYSGGGDTSGVNAIEMIFVKGGTFLMGCTVEQDAVCKKDERPAHTVTLSDFYISKYEVTFGQWKTVMGSYPFDFVINDEINNKLRNLPVEAVSFNEVQKFIQKLNTMTGKKYRLPTEAEWEYAARGGAKSRGYKYAGSNNMDDVAWYDANSGNKTHPVGTKAPNELGIYNMSGNALEWVSDWYGDYSPSAQTNPAGPREGSYRVMRGGGWPLRTDGRVSFRSRQDPAYGEVNMGFRLALSP
jgi:formylglycine-generating enzyme required for sulfatase activity